MLSYEKKIVYYTRPNHLSHYCQNDISRIHSLSHKKIFPLTYPSKKKKNFFYLCWKRPINDIYLCRTPELESFLSLIRIRRRRTFAPRLKNTLNDIFQIISPYRTQKLKSLLSLSEHQEEKLLVEEQFLNANEEIKWHFIYCSFQNILSQSNGMPMPRYLKKRKLDLHLQYLMELNTSSGTVIWNSTGIKLVPLILQQ